MAPETLTLDFNTTFPIPGLDFIAAFDNSPVALAQFAAIESLRVAKKPLDDEEDEDEEDGNDDDDNEFDEDEDEDEDDEDDEDDDDEDEDDEEEDEDEDVDELQVGQRR